MSIRSIALYLSLVVVLYGVLTANAAPVLQGETTQAGADSLKNSNDLKLEQQRMQSELDILNAQIDGLKKQLGDDAGDDVSETKNKLVRLENRARRIEGRIEQLGKRIEAGETTTDEWDSQWDDSWGDDEASFDDEWSIVDEDDESEDQFSFKPDLYKKYPGTFDGIFPLDSKLGETVLRYNRVEGVYLGIAQPKRLYWHSKPLLVGTGSLGYGFANHRWRYSLGLYLPLYYNDMIVEVGGEGHSFTDSKDQWIVNRDENTAMAFFAREDFMDYFGREGFSVSAAWYYKGPANLNLRATTAYVHDTYENLMRSTNWSLFGGEKVFRMQRLINPGNINSLVFSGAASTTPTVSPSMHGWSLQASYEMAGGFAKGDYEFTQLTVDLRRYQPLLEYLNLDVRARVALSDGTLPLQRAVELGGISTLPGYRFKEFAGTSGALVNAELILRSSIIEGAEGWVANVLTGFNVILFADAGVVNETKINVTRDFTNGTLDAAFADAFIDRQWKSDLGIAIGSSDGDFRIGLAWPMTKSELSRSPKFVLRFSRPF